MSKAARQMLFTVITSAAITAPAFGQARVSKQVANTAAVVSAPTSLTATMSAYGVWLHWPAVTNAIGYNVTRVSYPGNPETLIAARAVGEYVFEGNNCVAADAAPTCVYFDNQFRTTASRLTVTYRVYAVFKSSNGPVTSQASPPAPVVWSCPNCPKLP